MRRESIRQELLLLPSSVLPMTRRKVSLLWRLWQAYGEFLDENERHEAAAILSDHERENFQSLGSAVTIQRWLATAFETRCGQTFYDYAIAEAPAVLVAVRALFQALETACDALSNDAKVAVGREACKPAVTLMSVAQDSTLQHASQALAQALAKQWPALLRATSLAQQLDCVLGPAIVARELS